MEVRTKDYRQFSLYADDKLVKDGLTSADIPRVLPGDKVDADGKVIERKKHAMLVGLLDLRSKYKMDFSSRGVPLYPFYPHDPSYPSFMVGCSKRDVSKNLLVLIEVNDWQPGRAMPRGNLVRVLGPAGDLTAEKEALYWQYSPLATFPGLDLSDYGNEDTSPKRHDYRDEPTFSIDPPACKDVDDAISIDKTAYGSYCICISIADVAEAIPEDSELDTLARRIGTTLYQEGRQPRHMLPEKLSENVCSLKLNETRRVVSLSFIWNPGKEARSFSWSENLIKVKRKLTYEEAESMPEAHLLRQLTNDLKLPVSGTDSHAWVEALMLLYNIQAAKLLEPRTGGCFRKHDPASERWAAIHPDLRMLGFAAAQYAAKAEPHWGLGQASYCHATSPIRRYADLWNQRRLKEIIRGMCVRVIPPGLVASLNDSQKRAKQHDRDLCFLQVLSNREEPVTVDAIVIDDIRVYVPAWKRIVKFASALRPGQTVTLSVHLNPQERSWKRRMVMQILNSQ